MAKIVVENPIKWYVLFNRNKNNFIVDQSHESRTKQ